LAVNEIVKVALYPNNMSIVKDCQPL
jgi:hypothetical protein